MTYRIISYCEIPEKIEFKDNKLFMSRDFEIIDDLLSSPEYKTPNEQRTACRAMAITAYALSVDFAILNPPDYYRAILEEEFSEYGVIAIYPDYEISTGGQLSLIGFHATDTLPTSLTNTNLHRQYQEWLERRFNKVSETKLRLCQDPWRMFIQHTVRQVFRPTYN